MTEPELVTGSFPGWRVVTASFVNLVTTAGLGFYGLSVYLSTLSKERDFSVSDISSAGALFFVVSGVAGLWVAQLLTKYDVRRVVVAGAVLGSIAFALLGGVHEIWQVYAVYTLLGLGFSFAGLLPATTVVTRWFHAKRSTALSIASTGLSAGGVLITPAVKWALDRNGLSATTPWLAALWFVGIVPLTLAWMKPDPTALGWMPDGIRLDRTVATPALTGTPYDRAVRSRFFIAITIGYVFVLGSQVGGIQHLVKMVEERAGSGRATAATSILAMSSIVARLIGGQVAAKVPLARLTFGFAAVQGLSLLLASQAMSVPAIFGSVSLFGLTVGNLLMLQPLLIGQRFGVKDYARIFSRSQFYTLVGTAGGPYLLGFMHDHGGGYDVAYAVGGALSLLGAAIVFSGGPAEERTARI